MPASSGLKWLRGLGKAALDLFFPPFCVGCRRYGAWLCIDCRDRIDVIRPPMCLRCGLPLETGLPPEPGLSGSALSHGTLPPQVASAVCSHCRDARSSLDRLWAYAFHSGPLRQAIHEFKYGDLWSLAASLGELMAGGWAMFAADSAEVDAIVPVPLHRVRQRERGYNQAALLAYELGVHLDLPVVEGVLIRRRATAPQVGLNVQERRANVSGAFECLDDCLSGKRVLLVDDVYTTGSTLEAASAALRDRGVSLVWAYTLARAR